MGKGCIKFTAVDETVKITITLSDLNPSLRTKDNPVLDYFSSSVNSWIRTHMYPLEVTLCKGESFRCKGDNAELNTNSIYGLHFSVHGRAVVVGSIMSLLSDEAQLTAECFSDMFSGSDIITAPDLPAENLTPGIYKKMFAACKYLEIPPELPATVMAPECYKYMFTDCDSLIYTPDLNAQNLAIGCYEGMFYNCDRLKFAGELPAISLPDYCYKDMFRGCVQLSHPPMVLNAKTIGQHSYESMFKICSTLKKSPILAKPAAFCNNSYVDMFGITEIEERAISEYPWIANA